ncbi:MAG: error-prone DNA polymerase [Pseudomonadota bacterium]
MPSPNYAELHCRSNFTFLHGASSPEELVAQACALGYTALAITDECTLSGVVRAHMAARRSNLKLLIGSRFVLDDGLCFVLLARNRRGYGQMSHLITLARRQAVKGSYRMDRSLMGTQQLDDCLVLWIPPERDIQESDGVWLQSLLPQRVWMAVEMQLHGSDRRRLAVLQTLGERLAMPLAASGAVTMHVPQRRALRDTLTAIRLGRRLDELGFEIAPNSEQHLRPLERLAKLYPPALLQETVRIASLCDFSLDELRYEYPHELVPEGHTPSSWLRELTEEGVRRRWPQGESVAVRATIERELTLVAELRYEHFFLTVHDIVVFARSRHILCQGRGSAANSAICYCLGITEVNPHSMELLFERFLSKERDEPPDIDVDFEHERREEVIQYIYGKYGRQRAALAATVICYRARSAVRDVGKALGISEAVLTALGRNLDWYSTDIEGQIEKAKIDTVAIDIAPPLLRRLTWLVRELIGFPRHLSQHVGGFVISQGPLSELVPVENAAMADRTIIQWEKDDLEALGLLKVDVLALGMLTMIRKALDLVTASSGQLLSMDMIPQDDSAVYDMICAADTVGVFQIESRAQMSMLPRLKPRNYYDLVIQIAIVRPGPIQGNMVHPYLNRRSGREPVSFPSAAIKEVLQRTLGIPIFQEQVMKIAIVAAGFTGGEADQLRRAMAAWKKKGGLEPFRDKLISGMTARGYTEEFALQIYSQIKGFGEYGFPESHSASFALLAYVSSWLKHHHPAAFCCALLNSQPMGFYAPSQLVQDAQRHGVVVLPVDVNHSAVDCTLEQVQDSAQEGGSALSRQLGLQLVLRLGLSMVKGLSAEGAQRVCEARQQGAFRSVQSLVERTGIQRADRESLAAADALRALASDRHRAFWDVAGYEEKLPLLGAAGQALEEEFVPPDVDILLPKPSEAQNIVADYNSTALTLRRHPLALLRAHLDHYHVVPAAGLSSLVSGNRVKVVGIVTSRQRPQTASGVTFMTLEDESGFLNVVVWATLSQQCPAVVRTARLLGVSGRVQISEGVTHVLAEALVDLSGWLAALDLKSRDFQ